MNNERQHSEYKIIETVATPTFDGISVETHPEDQLEGGGETPTQQTLFRFSVGFGYYCFGKIVPGSLDFVDVCIYGPDSEHYYQANTEGVCMRTTGTINDNMRQHIQSACEHTIDKQAENVEIEIKTIPVGSEIENWDKYQLFTMQ